jgi:GNAT superfamily N-acetyltransferase
MQLIEVNDAKTRKEFLLFPVRLYRSQPYWIRPLDKDIEAVFDKEKNKFFRNGECIRWILKNAQGETIGRVAAFVNYNIASKDNDQPTGGLGFFECINDKQAAFTLFDACKAWLQSKNMEAMDGPINFGERDRWWGLLVDGFDHEPNYCCNYNYPYYQELFEAYGFQLYFRQFTYARKVKGEVAPKIARKAELIAEDPNYKMKSLELKDIDKYIEDFREVYNNAWANHKGVPKMTAIQARTLIKQMKPIMDPNLLWFAYYNDKPIGFFIMLPEVNQIFKHVNGKLDWYGKLVFLWFKLRKINRKIFGVIFGIDPQHQGKGVDGAIIIAVKKRLQEEYTAYDILEMNWIGDFNPKMVTLVEQQVGGECIKTHITYRKLFDENAVFNRMPFKDLGLR